MAAKTYRIAITRGDQHLEAEGDKAFVLAMRRRVGARTRRKSKPRATKIVGRSNAINGRNAAMSPFLALTYSTLSSQRDSELLTDNVYRVSLGGTERSFTRRQY